MLEKAWDSIKKKEFGKMVVCCTLPVLVIIGFQLAGINDWWIYPVALFVCFGSHIAMTWFGLREGKTCH